MVTWRCPNCRTVQVNASSCFLCNRSATSCGTCVNFRRSLVGGLGYCALDTGREPLSGEERRPCWTGATDRPTEGIFDAAAEAPRVPPQRGLLELSPRPALPAADRGAPPPNSGN